MKETGKILAVLCATQETEGLKRSIESLRRHGIEMYVYRMGQTWEGNGMKQVAAQYAAEKFQGKFDYILSLDGYDTLCLADEDEVLSKFMAFQNPMVICAEMNCWPNAKMACRYPPARSDSPFRFLNAGAYMAQTDYLVAMLKDWGITKEFKADSDQGFVTENFLSHPGCMVIDEACSLFQSLCDVKPEQFFQSGKRFINKKTFQVPCVLHGNGHTNMDYYWDIIK